MNPLSSTRRNRGAAVLLGAAMALPVTAPAWGQSPSASPPVLLRISSLSLEAAVSIVTAALKSCRERGALVAVVVTDRSGQALAMQRDPLAGMHTPETALRKAWTAVSFRGTTTDLERATAPDTPNHGIRHLPHVAMIGGGLPIEAAGVLVGAVGVSGAPGGDMDDECAKAGIDAVRDELELAS